jgi:dihydroorotase
MKRLIILNGHVVDPATNTDGVCNVYAMGGRISKVVPSEKDSADVQTGVEGQDVEVVDAAGMLVVPGLVDIHTHLRDPGYEYKETVETGAEAAKAGGFTTIACMANTDPVNDNASVTRYILRKAEATGINVLPVGALTVGLAGERLSEMGDLKEAGCAALSDDGMPVVDSNLMRRAMEYSKAFGLTVICHSEEPGLAGSGVMNEGLVSTRLGLSGIPNGAEDVMVARDIMLAELTGARVHIAHVSTRGSVELIRAAKARGVNVTAEATPHHLALTDERVSGYDTNAKMNPPLRTAEDVAALVSAVADGTIDTIATDHAPHSSIEKDVEFDGAANGVVGLETSFSVIYGLVASGSLKLSTAVAAMTVNPARALGLGCGTLAIGSAADITIIDPKASWTVDPKRFRSKSRNTPWAGVELKARVLRTISAGNTVFVA